MSSNFWRNLTYFVHYTFEIVISAHNPLAKHLFKNNRSKIYYSIKNYISILREEEKIPNSKYSLIIKLIKNKQKSPFYLIDFKPFLQNHTWLDFRVVEGLFKVLDAMWPEALFNMPVSLHIECRCLFYESI